MTPSDPPVPSVTEGPRRRLVLVGAGHAHLGVLDAWRGGRAPEGVELIVVVDRPRWIYSGMVPGVVAGDYAPAEAVVEVAPLVRAAGGRFVEAALERVDPQGRRLFLEGGGIVPYEVASLDIGAATAGLDVPGVRAHAVPTRPVARLLDLARAMEEGGSEAPVVVGGGAAGAELAAALAARGHRGAVLVEAGPRLLPERRLRVARRLGEALAARGVRVLAGAGVVEVEAGAVRLEDGRRVPSGLTVWAAGTAPPAPVRTSALPVDARGFLRVRDTLQVVGHPDLFAAGDCAAPEGAALPRAGVHAVRQGPVLRENLERRLAGRRLRSWSPQGDVLALLNLGDGRALGTKWGFTVEGRWVRWVKDRVDRRFVEDLRV